MNRHLPKLLECLGTVLVLVAVWRIGILDIRGQYLMLAAQFVWLWFAWILRLRWLALQSVALAGLTVLAILEWTGRFA